jgi:hypothetical protein
VSVEEIDERKKKLTYGPNEGGAVWWAAERKKNPSDSHFERGRGVVVTLEWAGGGLYLSTLD